MRGLPSKFFWSGLGFYRKDSVLRMFQLTKENIFKKTGALFPRGRNRAHFFCCLFSHVLFPNAWDESKKGNLLGEAKVHSNK